MVDIAPVNNATLPAILALLPAAADHRAMHWSAITGGELAGAAALHWQGLHDPPGFAISVFVRPAWRRRGIGRALIETMATAAAGETPGLWSANRHADDSAAAGFLHRLGFAPTQRELVFRMVASAVLAYLDPIVGRLRARGRIPPGTVTPCLRDAPLDHVAIMVADQFGQPPGRVKQRLVRALTDPAGARLDPDVSTVTIEQGKVVGIVLAAITDGVAIVDCNIVAPDHRRSWTNAVQLHVATRRAHAFTPHIDFTCDETVRDSVNMAVRTGGILTASTARYWRAV